MTTPSDNTPYSVSQLNRLARDMLEDCFSNIQVRGEISGISRPASGHWYFTLKDERAQIRCAMFRNRNMAVRFTPEEGQQLILGGKVGLYEARGDYQFIADTMQPDGSGALALAFEQLKQQLKAEGLFDSEHKEELPTRPQHIALITSPTGAAIRDILSVLNRRWPALRITLLPVQVQGDEAAGQIAAAIEQANRHAKALGFELIICSRGGGSIEDLWAFNERIVAEAIFNSSLPVVSAVGHETDFTIADFVADVRAPTPSAAAEIISPDQDDIRFRLDDLNESLQYASRMQLFRKAEALQNLRQRLRHPGRNLQQQSQRLDDLNYRLGLLKYTT